MSVLEGGNDHRNVFPVKNPYGRELKETFSLKLEDAQDIAVNSSGSLAYIAGSRKLYIFDITAPDNPVTVSVLEGLGAGRQIEIDEESGTAYITARADGLYICDISDPKSPALLCHYDTVELATGVCFSAGYCFVACRHLGVEIIDVSYPRRPIHAASVLAGEAQSVFVEGIYMYVGAWMNRQVMIFDISDPCNPALVSVCPLDGFGDGVYVKDNICYAATGHHSTRLINRKKFFEYDFVTAEMLNEGYGGGHGLEIFDVTDRKNPVFLSRIKAPPLFMGGTDTWDVTVAGRYAFLSDAWNGLFVINVVDLKNPHFEGYKRLGLFNQTRYLRQPSVQQLCNPVNGLAVIKDRIMAVSAFGGGLHVIEADGMATLPEKISQSDDLAETAGKRASQNMAWIDKPFIRTKQYVGNVVFRSAGQVHSVLFHDNKIIAAAGGDGLYVLDQDSGNAAHDDLYNVVAHIPTAGFAMDLKTDGRYFYLAEGTEGLSIWIYENNSMKLVSGCRPGDRYEKSARQVIVYKDAGIAGLHLGSGSAAFINISDPLKPEVISVFTGHGMMYYKTMCEGTLKGRYAAVAPLSQFTYWYDLRDGLARVPGFQRDLCPVEEGIALDGDRYLTVYRGKYYILDDIMAPKPNESEMITVYKDGEELYINGWPRIIGNRLFLINRMSGLITEIDISDVRKPVYLDSFVLPENPENVLSDGSSLWIPFGHGGLLKLDPVG